MNNWKPRHWGSHASAAMIVASLGLVGCDEPAELGANDEVDDVRPLATSEANRDLVRTYDDAGLEEAASEASEPAVLTPRVIMASFQGVEANRPGMIEGESGGVIELARSGADTVRVGEPLDYEIEITNTADFPVANVTVQEIATAGFEYDDETTRQRNPGVGYEGPSQPSQDDADDGATSGDDARDMQGRQGQQQSSRDQQRSDEASEHRSWTVDMLMPGESKTISVSGVARTEGQLRSCMTVTYEPVWCSSVKVVEPELRVVQEVPREVYACEEIPLRYTVMNLGSGESREVRIAAELPDGLTAAQSQTSMTAGKLPAGERSTKQMMLNAASGGEYTIRATASTDSLNAKSNKSIIRVLEPELALTVDGPSEQYTGRDVTWTVTLENTSDDPAIETWIEVPAPEGAERVSFSSQRAAWDGRRIEVGRLEGGESRSYELSFVMNEATTAMATIRAAAYCVDEMSKAIETNVQGIAAAQLEMIDAMDPVEVGSETSYEIRVTNEGNAKDFDVTVTGTLPAELEFVRAEGDSDVTADGRTLAFGTIDELAPGEVATWRVYVRATKAGKVLFPIELTSGATTRAVPETEPTTIY